MIAQSGKGARKTSSTCLSCGFKQIYHVSNAEEGCWGAVPRGSEHTGELTWWINQAVLVKALGVEGRPILPRCSWTGGRVPMAICGRYDSFWENTPILLYYSSVSLKGMLCSECVWGSLNLDLCMPSLPSKTEQHDCLWTPYQCFTSFITSFSLACSLSAEVPTYIFLKRGID